MTSDLSQREPRANAVVFVVMEWGAEWPSDPDLQDLGWDVVKQEAAESYPELARRAQERAVSVESTGGVIRVAVLSCSGDRGPEAFAGRGAVAGALIGAVRRGAGELRVVAPGDVPLAARPSFISLADELMGALRGSAAWLHLRFGGETPRAQRPPARGRRRRAGRHDRAAHAAFDRRARAERRPPDGLHG
jgi:hypothetical protein